MNTDIETARKLIIECSKELPCLAAVQRICETSFNEVRNPPLKWRPAFEDTDCESLESTRATFVAYHWCRDRSAYHPLNLTNEEEGKLFDLEEHESILEFYVRTLEQLHNVQLRKDPRFMNHLRHGYEKFRERFAKAMRED